ncbi:hypothetical protein AVEN_100264-1 [Araneus ventricosus]|uniref:Uncharacterized protein n=1 Tax=Araneus ventricosus TaxID=182803 RepID=A0A4Y2RVG2_ARAVE|nr:hypothetical protein AVEN_100264-1 [Araneus ventricosus]
MKTVIETYEKIKKQVVVIGQNVDLLVLLTALTPDSMDILMLKEGKGRIKDRFYSSKDLRNSNLVIECKNSIHFLHAISGCDTTSGFYGKGKLQAVQLFNHTAAGPLVVYMGVNDLFTTSIPNWMGSNTVLVMFALSEMCDGSVDVQLLWLEVTWRKE